MLVKSKKDKERLEDIYTLVSERDVKSYKLSLVELNERITRIIDESGKLIDAIRKTETFGTDYNEMTEAQQYELGSYVNLMEASTALLVDPILGLQPKYTEQDFDRLCDDEYDPERLAYYREHKDFVISLANTFYKIELNDDDKKLLARSLKKNKEFLSSVNMPKKELDDDDIAMVQTALKHKYKHST